MNNFKDNDVSTKQDLLDLCVSPGDCNGNIAVVLAAEYFEKIPIGNLVLEDVSGTATETVPFLDTGSYPTGTTKDDWFQVVGGEVRVKFGINDDLLKEHRGWTVLKADDDTVLTAVDTTNFDESGGLAFSGNNLRTTQNMLLKLDSFFCDGIRVTFNCIFKCNFRFHN